MDYDGDAISEQEWDAADRDYWNNALSNDMGDNDEDETLTAHGFTVEKEWEG